MIRKNSSILVNYIGSYGCNELAGTVGMLRCVVAVYSTRGSPKESLIHCDRITSRVRGGDGLPSPRLLLPVLIVVVAVTVIACFNAATTTTDL